MEETVKNEYEKGMTVWSHNKHNRKNGPSSWDTCGTIYYTIELQNWKHSIFHATTMFNT
jgi:hypothetical protein